LPPRPDAPLEDEIDFTRYFRVFARHWVLLVVVGLLGGVLGFAVSRMKPVLYEGVTTVLVLPPAKGDARTASTANFRALLENLTHGLQVINELGLDKPPFSLTPQRFHDEALRVEEVPGTNFMRVRVRLTDPTRAMETRGFRASVAEMISNCNAPYQVKGADWLPSIRSTQIVMNPASRHGPEVAYRSVPANSIVLC